MPLKQIRSIDLNGFPFKPKDRPLLSGQERFWLTMNLIELTVSFLVVIFAGWTTFPGKKRLIQVSVMKEGTGIGHFQECKQEKTKKKLSAPVVGRRSNAANTTEGSVIPTKAEMGNDVAPMKEPKCEVATVFQLPTPQVASCGIWTRIELYLGGKEVCRLPRQQL